MNPFRVKSLLLGLMVLGLLGAACHREIPPPPPLGAEQIPVEFEKAFKSAPEELKALAERVTTSLEKKDYAAAYEAVQSLCVAPGATKEQASLATRAMLTITTLLQTAQSQGDEKAGAVLDDYKISR